MKEERKNADTAQDETVSVQDVFSENPEAQAEEVPASPEAKKAANREPTMDELIADFKHRQETTPFWYILNTYSGYEMMVKDSLLRLIENNNLQDQIFDVKIPMEQTIEERSGKRKVVDRKILPSYVFIKMIYSNQLWYLVTNTRGVVSFVGPQGRPIPIKEDEIRKMRLEEVAIDVDFAVGDKVSIDAGPLEGYEGVICELNDGAQKAKVSIQMFGRNTDVEVEYIQIKKLAN